MTHDTTQALTVARDALEQIALAGMSGTGQESEEAMRAWHAQRAREFIGIAARALEPVRAALAATPAASRSAAPGWVPIETVPATSDDVLIFTQGRTVRLETGHYARNMLHASKVDGDECYFVLWKPVDLPPVTPSEGGKQS